MGFNMQKLMKQAQKMQADMARIQEELRNTEITEESGGGMVKVTVNGAQEVLAIEINPEIVDPEEVEMLEDLVLAAVKSALAAAQSHSANEMAKVTGGMGMNLPGIF